MKYRVKKRWPLAGSFVVIVLGLIVFWSCFLREDPLGYQEIMERANPAVSLESARSYRASQSRKGVQKRVWQVKGGLRLEARVDCDETDLVYEQEGEKQAIVEHMKGVVCVIQEEQFFADASGRRILAIEGFAGEPAKRQTVRLVVADTAKYHYSSETLQADHVKMALYTIPGHELPGSLEGFKPSMEGEAETLNLTIIEKELKFKADKFKGSIF